MGLKQSIKDIFSRPIFVFLSLLFFLTPLTISSETNELFEFPKMFFVYSMGIILIAVFLTQLVLRKQSIKMPSLPVIFLLVSYIISTFFSVHPYTSFWGYYTRFNDGLLSLLVFIAIYFVLKNTIKDYGTGDFMKIIALTIYPVGLVGILQHFGFGVPSVDRVYSTFGQPNWLAQYLVMILPYILYLFITEAFIFWAILFIVGFSCLWFTYSMSGLFAFVILTLTLVVLYFLKNVLNTKSILKILTVYLVCLIVAVTNLGIFRDKLNDALKDMGEVVSVEKIYAQEDGYKVSDPGYIRLGLWKGTLNLFISSPKVFLIGTGLETFPYSFQPFRPPELNFSSEWEYVFNKPHNYYLEVLAEAGIVGFGAYLFLLFRLAKRLPYYLLPGFLAFLITNFFGWPVVSTALLFWFWVSWSETYSV